MFAKFARTGTVIPPIMKKTIINILTILSASFMMTCLPAEDCHAQRAKGKGEYLHYIIEGKDTIYIDEIRASKVYSRLPKQKGKEWRKYYRLVHNFSKAYPYALAARNIIRKADKDIEDNNLKRLKRDRYINTVQYELF